MTAIQQRLFRSSKGWHLVQQKSTLFYSQDLCYSWIIKRNGYQYQLPETLVYNGSCHVHLIFATVSTLKWVSGTSENIKTSNISKTSIRNTSEHGRHLRPESRSCTLPSIERGTVTYLGARRQPTWPISLADSGRRGEAASRRCPTYPILSIILCMASWGGCSQCPTLDFLEVSTNLGKGKVRI